MQEKNVYFLVMMDNDGIDLQPQASRAGKCAAFSA
jgi:hypothetical protein